ncbi:nSTAND1 domain-containing NTPase [Streptomyces sp. MUM 178J]|uniref:nSTAND1 domain-containing NTPase n=1 Tax=Streptomyces sp. MUM 178J TaxID=2791991 RepID=UPI001F039792|nr:hypothetical protein [Streptomyces sp. MUM 178J]WRQ78019.1 hypothetical protein I3F59_000690 [Streptomyces sp. MUM 178J]
MARKETPLDGGDGPLLRFAHDLRRLRRSAGAPTYRMLAAQAHYSIATLSSAASGRRLPSLDVALSYVRACGGDVDAWERRWHEVAAELSAEQRGAPAGGRPAGTAPAGDAAHTTTRGRPPYAGLAPLDADDADRFFGRERPLEDLIALLRRHRLVALLGASGAGKSSLLHAGLLPRLHAENPRRTLRVITPGQRPLTRLAELPADPSGHSPDDEGLLIVDQFEEVFTLCRSEQERRAFISAVVEASRGPDARCRAVLGVRADFYGHCARHPDLVEVLRDAQLPLGPMRADELRRAVVQPARHAGLHVEGALQATLVAHAHGRAGALPLLSHALLETWSRRRGTTLTLDGFRAAGGLDGALAQTAESFYSSLAPRRQRLAQVIFVRLVALGEGTQDTGRSLAPGGLDDDPDTAAVLERAVHARLLTADRGRVQLAHEALIGAWPRLRGWLAEDRDRLRIQHRLSEAAQAWEDVGRDAGALYRGVRLELARELLAGARPGLTAREREFIEASAAAEAAASSSARRRVRVLRNLVALLAVLAAVAGLAIVRAERAQHEVTRQRDSAAARDLSAAATGLYHSDPALAVQLALVAHRLAPGPATRDSLLSTLAAAWTAHPSEVGWLAFGPARADGTLLATASGDHTARLWRVRGARAPAAPAGTLTGHRDDVRSVAVSPQGRMVATASADATVRLWEVSRPGGPRPLAVLTAHRDDVRTVAFGPDGRLLATAGEDKTVRLWEVSRPGGPRPLAVLTAHHDTVRSVAFSRDGRTLATAGEDKTTRLWDLADPGSPTALATVGGHTTTVFSVAFSPDGRTLATAGGLDTPTRLWDITRRSHPAPLATLTGHTDVVGSVAFSPDGRTLATASDDRTARLWDVTRPAGPEPLATIGGYTTAVGAVAFSPDGGALAASGYDHTVRLLDLDFERLFAHACTRARPTITRAQWAAHAPYLDYDPPCARAP